MVRQCAWCLRLIDSDGERISVSPLPRLYEASHVMCSDCGNLWVEQVPGVGAIGRQKAGGHGSQTVTGMSGGYVVVEREGMKAQMITDMVLQLQKNHKNNVSPLDRKVRRVHRTY